MATVNINVTAEQLSENSPLSVLNITFNYTGTTIQNGTTIYYSAALSDGDISEEVVFSLPVTPGDEIPASESFAYVPEVTFADEVTGADGMVYYTA